MVVNLNELKKVLDYLAVINKADLSDIEWIINGEEISVESGDIIQWQYIGLNNVHFAETNQSLLDCEG